jgi:hypothetical protein
MRKRECVDEATKAGFLTQGRGLLERWIFMEYVVKKRKVHTQAIRCMCLDIRDYGALLLSRKTSSYTENTYFLLSTDASLVKITHKNNISPKCSMHASEGM